MYLIIYGAKGDTGQLMLRQSGSYRNKFERGKTDTFKIEATDIGQVINEPCPEKTRFLPMQNIAVGQLCNNCKADQRLCFHYTDSTISLLLKSEILSI